VFQTFPFLEQAQQAFQSARDFANEILKPVNSDAPSDLERRVEEKLENEINSESAQVVQGDGSLSSLKKDDLCDPENAAEVHIDSVKDEVVEEDLASQDSEPSWVSKSPWLSPPISPSEDKRIEFQRHDTVQNAASMQDPSFSPVRSRSPSISNAFLRLSPLVPPKSPLMTPSQPYPSPQSSSVPPSMRRIRSRPYLKIPDMSSNPPSKEYLYSTAAMSPTLGTPAPRPSIRRSHSSHPDITVLCNQWAHNGPANQTFTFKPDATYPSRRRRQSLNSIMMAGNMKRN
jgi:hypothetical protein